MICRPNRCAKSCPFWNLFCFTTTAIIDWSTIQQYKDKETRKNSRMRSSVRACPAHKEQVQQWKLLLSFWFRFCCWGGFVQPGPIDSITKSIIEAGGEAEREGEIRIFAHHQVIVSSLGCTVAYYHLSTTCGGATEHTTTWALLVVVLLSTTARSSSIISNCFKSCSYSSQQGEKNWGYAATT